MATTTTDYDFGSTALDVAHDQGPKAAAVILGVGVIAFSIKGLWIGWRAGSKAMGKAGG